jgi:hypothetical protein
VTNDARIVQQAPRVARGERGDAVDIEAGECRAEVVPLAQNRQPAEARLKPFEADLLEEAMIVGDGNAPLLIVIPLIQRVPPRPPAPHHPIVSVYQARWQFLHKLLAQSRL